MCKIRKTGLNMIHHLLDQSHLLISIRYSVINGYLGLNSKDSNDTLHCLDDVNLITPYLKVEMLLSQLSVTEWCIETFRNYVLKDIPCKAGKMKCSTAKVNLNIGTYTLLRDIPRARMLLAILGMLASGPYNPSELTPLINSGIIGAVLALLKQVGGEQIVARKVNGTYVLYADMIESSKPKAFYLSGPEIASRLRLGTKVVRGADWKWGDQV